MESVSKRDDAGFESDGEFWLRQKNDQTTSYSRQDVVVPASCITTIQRHTPIDVGKSNRPKPVKIKF
jgi:hypothetical protein